MTTTRERVPGAETDMTPIKKRFGGADPLAGLVGMFAALGVLVFVQALIAAGAGGIGFQMSQIDVDGNLRDVEVVGAIVAIVTVFAAFLVGGWVAGRVARYDGAVNGLGAALWFVLAVAVFGAAGVFFGSEYNAFANADLPNWFAQFDADGATLKVVAAAAAGVVAAALGGYVGGELGEKYHTQVDAALTSEAVRPTA